MSDQRPVWLKAFVGRSFLEKDEAIWNEIRKMLVNLRPIGFVFEDASEAQPRPISQKVRAGIDQNDLYLGILTQRFPIYSSNTDDWAGQVSAQATPDKWGTSSWIVQESGYALGKNKRVILMLEEGVDFPKSDMDADQERIVFSRGHEIQCFGSLTSMIGNLVAERLPQSRDGETVAQVTSAPSTESRQQNLDALQAPTLRGAISLLDKKEIAEADRQMTTILEAQKSHSDKIFLESIYLREKAIRGHSEALEKLNELAQESQDLFVWDHLADYYAAFNRFSEAAVACPPTYSHL